MITLQKRREDALRAGYVAMLDRFPDLDYEFFKEKLSDWEAQAFCDGDKPVGMLLTKDAELHVAVIPEVRGKWLSKRLLREIFAPIFRKYGLAKTRVMPGNDAGKTLVSKLGFTGEDVLTLREGFKSLAFDPGAIFGGIASNLLGGIIGGGAAESAADAQLAAANNAAATQRYMFDTTNQQQAPYREAGYTAVKDILGGLGLGPQQKVTKGFLSKQFRPADLMSGLAPNYRFQLNQGLGAVRNAGNLQTGLLSGNTLKGINDYAQNYAGGAYQQAFNNYTSQQSNIFNRLSAIAGYGQTANQATGQAATAAGGQIGNSLMAGGAAQASGLVGQANALTGGLSNAAGWFALPSIMGGGSGGGGIDWGSLNY